MSSTITSDPRANVPQRQAAPGPSVIGLAPQFQAAQIPLPLIAFIPAGGTKQLQIQGQFLYVKEAYGIPGNIGITDVEIATDITGPIPFNLGTGVNMPAGSQFKLLQISNPNAFEIYLEIIVGYGEYIDRRLNIVRDRPGSIAISMEPAVEIDPWVGAPAGTYIIPPGSGVLFTPVLSGLRIAVKGFTVANGDPNSPVDILNTAGEPFGRVIANTSQMFPCSHPFEVFNDTGAGIEVFVGIMYWLGIP